MNLRKLLLTNNNCYKAGKAIVPKGIMVHSTGANNPNLRRYVGPDDGLLGKASPSCWNTATPGEKEVCVHAFIGKLKDGTIATYQTLPWNMRGWHGGGSCNNTHIGFEICEDGLSDPAYFSAVYKEAVELCVYLCKQYGLTEKNILCHCEGHKLGIASNHADVMHWFPKHGKSMDTFRTDVKAGLATVSIDTATGAAVAGTTGFEPYRVRVSISNLNIRKGPGTNYAKTGKYTGKGVFTIVEEASGTGATKWGKLKSGTGWISLDYAVKH